jgi:hypothetical protein
VQIARAIIHAARKLEITPLRLIHPKEFNPTTIFNIQETDYTPALDNFKGG